MKLTVYVALLDEGTPCSRPTPAEDVGNGLFRLLPTSDYDPDDENWEYKPGALVALERRKNGNEEYLLAVAPGSPVKSKNTI